MKKLVSMLTAVMMIITMLSVNASADAQNPIYSNNFDSFETTSNGTALISGHGFNNLANAVYNADDLNASTYLATRAVSGKGNSLEFVKGSTCGKAIELSLVGAPAWKGCSTIEFDVMREELKGADFYVAYRSSAGQMKFISFSREGKILVNAVDTGVTYSANTWYRVKMTMNITGGFAEILLNGGEHTNKIITASIPALTSLPNRLDIGFNYINASGEAKANALIDNIVIYEDVLSGYDVYEKEGFDSFDEGKEFKPGGDGLNVSAGGGFTMRNYSEGLTYVTLTKDSDGDKFITFISGGKIPTLGRAVKNYGQNVAFEYTIGFDEVYGERQVRLFLADSEGNAAGTYLVPKFAEPWVQVGVPASPNTVTESFSPDNTEFKVRAFVDFTAHKMYVDIINLTTGENLLTNCDVDIAENAVSIKEYQIMMGDNTSNCTTTIDDIKFYSANAPRLLYTTPADKATGLGLYDSFSITANNELDMETVVSSNVKLTKNGVEIDSSKCKVIADDEKTFRIYPYAKYDENATYTVSANGIKDIFGKTLPSYQYTFTTGEDDGIGEIEFALNGEATETVGKGTMKASVDVSFNAPRDVILIIAKYTDNGEVLADMAVSVQKMQKSGTIEAFVNVGDGEEGSVIKAFLWDGLNNARPYQAQKILGK